MGAKVTDRDGRYAFTAPAGSYRLEVQKPGFSFPATSMSGVDDDGKFYGIYHGTLLEVPFGGGAVTANIPLDPTTGPMEEPKVLLSAANKRGVRRFLASFGPILGVLALVARPSLVTVALLGIQIAAFALFRRLSVTPEPKTKASSTTRPTSPRSRRPSFASSPCLTTRYWRRSLTDPRAVTVSTSAPAGTT